MDQDINRNINITVTESASPTLEELARDWQELRQSIAASEAQVRSMGEELNRRFRPIANNVWQDIDNKSKIATNQYRKLEEQIRQATEALNQQRRAQQEVGTRMQGMGTPQEIAATQIRLINEQRAAEKAANAEREAIGRARQEQIRAQNDVLQQTQREAQQANVQVQNLEQNIRDLQVLLQSREMMRENPQYRQLLLGQLNEMAQQAGMRHAPDVIPGFDPAKEEKELLRLLSQRDNALKQIAEMDRKVEQQENASHQRRAVADEKADQAAESRRQREIAAAEAQISRMNAARERDIRATEQQYLRQAQALEASQRKAAETAQRFEQRPGVGTGRAASSAAAAEEAQLRRTVAAAEAAARARANAVITGERQAVEAAEAATDRYIALQREQVAAAERAAAMKAALSAQVARADAEADRNAERRAHRQSLGGQFEHALLNTALYTTAFTMIMQLQQAATDLVAAMFQKPAEEEAAVVVYTRYLGDATEAQERFNAVMKESTKVGLPAKDLLELDTRLAQLGVTSETAQQRFGRSLEQVRKDLEDLSASPSLDPQQVIEFFTRAADGANRLLLSLKSAGVTTEQELRDLGVRLNRQGTQILSDNNTTTRALLTVIERHYSGLAEATGKTALGMQQRWSNTWEEIARIFGDKSGIFDEVKRRQQEMLDAISSDETQSGLEKFSENLGDSVTAILYSVDVLTSAFNAFVNNVVDIAGQLPGVQGLGIQGQDFMTTAHERIKAYRDGLNEATDATANLGQVGQQAFDDTSQQVELAKIRVEELTEAVNDLEAALRASQRAEKDIIAPLRDARDMLSDQREKIDDYYSKQIEFVDKHIEGIRDAAKASQEAAEAQITPLQDHLQDLARQSENIRASYDAQIKPLKAQEDQLRRNFEMQNRISDLARLDAKIARDKALSVDIYSQEGRSAFVELPDLLKQREDMQRKNAYDDERARLEKRVEQLESARDAKLSDISNDQRRTQDQISLIQRREKADQDAFKREEALWEKRRSNLEHEQETFDDMLQAQIDATDAQIKTIQKQFDREQDAIQKQIDATKEQMELLDKVINGSLEATGKYAEMVQKTVKEVFDQLPDFPTRDNDFTKPSYENNPPPKTSNRGPGYWYQDHGQWVWQSTGASGRASGGSVDEGWYVVGENGREYLHAGGPGSITPNGAGGITVVVNLDGREAFRQHVEENRDFVNKQVAISMRSNR